METLAIINCLTDMEESLERYSLDLKYISIPVKDNAVMISHWADYKQDDESPAMAPLKIVLSKT